MRRIALLFLLALLAAPLAAQSPQCTQSRTTRMVDKGAQWVSGVLKTWYVSADSVAKTCKGFPSVTIHDTVYVDSSAAPAPPAPVDSAPTTPPPAPSAGLYPNRPASYTRVVSDYAFSAATYPGTSSASCELPGGFEAGWGLVLCNSSAMRRVSDPAAPQSAPYVMEQSYPAGAGSGGNVAGFLFFNGPGVQGSELYVSLWVWYSPGFPWNTISQKLLYWESGNILLQQKHNDDFLSMYIGAQDRVYDPNRCTPTRADFEGKWAHIEWQVKRGTNGLLRVWLNGTLCSDYAVAVPTGSGNEFNLNSTWGGSTGPIPTTGTRRVDHVLLATP